MVRISAVDVASERKRDLAVSGVVGGVEYEFAHWLEMALDAVQMAGVRRRRHQLHVVRSRPFADLMAPVQDEIVIDQIDPQAIRIAATDVLVEGQDFTGRLGETVAAEQHISVDVEGAEEVAHAASPHVGGTLAPRPLALGVTMARVGLERNRAELVEADHYSIARAGAVQRHDASGLLLEQRIGAALPSPRALEGDILLTQDATQRLDRDARHDLASLQIPLQASQRPARQRLAEGGWRRQSDHHDTLTDGRLKRLRPASTDFWVQTVKPELVEGVDHLTHVGLVGLEDQRDLVHGRVHHRRQQDLRTLAQRAARQDSGSRNGLLANGIKPERQTT